MQNSNLKVILLGDGRVGKTSIINKYINNQFNDTETMTTNCSFTEKEVTYDNQKYKINIWDTAGQEKFNALTSIYYRDAKGVILVYDITNPYSFTRVTKWVEELSQYNKEAKLLLVGNKVDTNDWQVNQKDCLDYAKERNCNHYFASAKTGLNIQTVFDRMTEILVANAQKSTKSSVASNRLDISSAGNSNKSGSKGCCS